MQLKEIMFFTLAFSLAATIVADIGLWQVKELNTSSGQLSSEDVDISHFETISEANSNAENLAGTGLTESIYGTLSRMFSILTLPAGYLKEIGFPAIFANSIGVMIYAVEAWGILQLVWNRSGKSME